MGEQPCRSFAEGMYEGGWSARGGRVEAVIAQEDTIMLVPDKVFKKDAFLTRLAKLQASMRMTKPVVERMRRESRY
jgi:hypothetical protein